MEQTPATPTPPELRLIEINGELVPVLDSRVLADCIGLYHLSLLTELEALAEQWTQPEGRVEEDFIRAEHQDEEGNTQPYYLLSELAVKIWLARQPMEVIRLLWRPLSEAFERLRVPQLPPTLADESEAPSKTSVRDILTNVSLTSSIIKRLFDLYQSITDVTHFQSKGDEAQDTFENFLLVVLALARAHPCNPKGFWQDMSQYLVKERGVTPERIQQLEEDIHRELLQMTSEEQVQER